MDRKAQWLLLVQVACLHYDQLGQMAKVYGALWAIQNGGKLMEHPPLGHFDNPLWPLADALRVEPSCIPPDLERAAWDFVDMHLLAKPRPGWLEYLPEEAR